MGREAFAQIITVSSPKKTAAASKVSPKLVHFFFAVSFPQRTSEMYLKMIMRPNLSIGRSAESEREMCCELTLIDLLGGFGCVLFFIYILWWA